MGEGLWGRVPRMLALFCFLLCYLDVNFVMVPWKIHLYFVNFPSLYTILHNKKFERGKLNNHSLYKTTIISLIWVFFCLRIELKYGAKHMGSRLNLYKIFVLFGKRIVQLINVNVYVKFVYNFHAFPKHEKELGKE